MLVSIHMTINAYKQSIRDNNGIEFHPMYGTIVSTVNDLLKVAWTADLVQSSINKFLKSLNQITFR